MRAGGSAVGGLAGGRRSARAAGWGSWALFRQGCAARRRQCERAHRAGDRRPRGAEPGRIRPRTHRNQRHRERETTEGALRHIEEANESAGYEPGEDIAIAMDPAATELYKDGMYRFLGEAAERSASEMVDYLDRLCSRYPAISIGG